MKYHIVFYIVAQRLFKMSTTEKSRIKQDTLRRRLNRFSFPFLSV